ncbi:MAG: S9 family peptidase [Gemmatimonadaceae bacterium]
MKMSRRALSISRRSLVALAVAALVLPSASGAQGFTLDDYAKVARVSDLRVNAKGDGATMLVAWPNYDTNTWDAEVVYIDLATKATRMLTHRRNVSTPRWSPIGDRFAFLSAVDGRSQLFVMSMSGGDARQLTTGPTSVGSYVWKPDGKTIAYTAAAAAPARGKFDDSFEVSDNDYLTLSAPRSAELWTIAADGGPATNVAKGAWSVPSLFATITFSPDGRSIIFTKQDGAGSRGFEKRDLTVVDLASGNLSTLRGTEGRHCGGAFGSPDASQLLLVCPVDSHVKNQTELVLLPTAGGTARRLTASLDRNFSRGTWRPDNKSIFATAADGTISALWEIPLEGAPRRIDVGRIGVGDVDVTSDGTIVFIGTEATRPSEIYVIRPGGEGPERITDIHHDVAAMSLGKVEAFSWKSDDGLPLDGIITLPPNFDATKKYPLLLNIHGGPWGSSRELFSTRNQLMAGKGFVVFEPNYRGSDNHGNALFSAVYRDHGAGPGRDVMAGLSILKKRAYVDTTRIGVSGWSYGGYMTTWLIGHYTGWKAAMAGAAVIDLVDDYNLNDLSLYLRAYGETLTMPKDLALMKEQSPMNYVDNMKTPLLLLSDQGDVRVPVTQSYKLYNALRERGQDVRMRLWPVPGHFPGDPWRARDIDREWVGFFEQRLR